MWQIGSIDLAVSSNYSRKDHAASIADTIDYLYIITNNGLLTLYNIVLRMEDPIVIVCDDIDGVGNVEGIGSVEGLASYPGDGLAPAGYLICRATGGVSRAEVSSRAKRGLGKYWHRSLYVDNAH